MSSLPMLPFPLYAQSLLSYPKPPQNPPQVATIISSLSLQPHPEGGFFVETDRDPHLVPNPFIDSRSHSSPASSDTSGTTNGDGDIDRANESEANGTISSGTAKNNANINAQAYNHQIANRESDSQFRHASTTIHYYLAPSSPLGRFHRNKARTVHTLHWGRGAYVVLHPPNSDGAATQNGHDTDKDGGRGQWRAETFVVGKNVSEGERVQWIVDGGRYKASYLLPDAADAQGRGAEETDGATEMGNGNVSEAGLLITETVVPGFEYADHDFLTAEGLNELMELDVADEIKWLLGREQERRWEEMKN